MLSHSLTDVNVSVVFISGLCSCSHGHIIGLVIPELHV